MFASTTAFSQNVRTTLDSLHQELERTTTPTEQVELSIVLGGKYLEKDLNRSRDLYIDALAIYERNQVLFEPLAKAELLDCLGVVERRASNYVKAFKYYLQSLEIKEQINDSTTLGRSYHNIAGLYNKQREYETSRIYWLKALPIRKEHSNSISYAKTLNGYAATLRALHLHDSARYYMSLAKQHFGSNYRVADVNTQLGILEKKEGNYEKAIALYKENLEIFEKEALNERVIVVSILLAAAYRHIGQPHESITYIRKAERLALEVQNTSYLLKIYAEAHLAYSALGDYKKAYDYALLHKTYKDSTYNFERAKSLAALEINYEYDKQKLIDSLQFIAEKQIIESQTERQRAQKWLLVSFLGFLTLGLYHSLTRYRHKLKKEHLENEVLNEKLVFLNHQVEQLSNDNHMRIEFKKDLLEKIKKLKEHKKTRTAHEFQRLISEMQTQINTESRLDALHDSKKELNPLFEQKLYKLYPELTKSEREICNLIRMNLSLKEIANIRDTTVGAISTTRYRIRKKIAIPKGKELELFIQQLFDQEMST